VDIVGIIDVRICSVMCSPDLKDRAGGGDVQKVWFTVASVLLLCCGGKRPEDERTAVWKAEQFTTATAVKQHFGEAYGMLSPDERTRTSREELEQDIRSQHGGGFPTSVRATQYSLVPKLDGVMVYFVGELPTGRMYYQVAMKRSGGVYYASGLNASKEPFPDFGRPRQPVGG